MEICGRAATFESNQGAFARPRGCTRQGTERLGANERHDNGVNFNYAPWPPVGVLANYLIRIYNHHPLQMPQNA